MFDDISIGDARQATAALPLVLDAASIDAWTAVLSCAIEVGSGVDDGERVDALAALERLGCVVTSAQAHLARELDDSQRAVQAAAGVASARRGAGVAQQVGLARRESPHRDASTSGWPGSSLTSSRTRGRPGARAASPSGRPPSWRARRPVSRWPTG